MTIIFDLDGTLFQTEPNTARALRQIAEEYRQNALTSAEISLALSLPPREYYDYLKARLNVIDFEPFRTHLRELERASIREYGELFAGTIEMLQILHGNGHTLEICSNSTMEYIEIVVGHTNIRHFFSKIVSAREFHSKIECLREMISPQCETSYVGDAIHDVVAAKANNLPFIAALYGYNNTDELLNSSFTVDTPSEIISRVSQADLFFKLKRAFIDSSKRIIGINGIDTSGKTQFTDSFSRFLTSLGIANDVLHIDDFHNPREVRRGGDYYDCAFDLDTVATQILKPLRDNGVLDMTLNCLDLDSNKYENERRYSISQKGILLIEGTLLFRSPIIEYLDAKIFLQISFNEALRRAEIRDIPRYGEKILEEYKTRYLPAQERYFRECHPIKIADVVIDNSDWTTPKIVVKLTVNRLREQQWTNQGIMIK
jgi:phosphoglycolate phosphatase